MTVPEKPIVLYTRIERRQFSPARLFGSRRHGAGFIARVAELVDALDLGSSGVTREGSSPSFRTISTARPGTTGLPRGLWKASGGSHPIRQHTTNDRQV